MMLILLGFIFFLDLHTAFSKKHDNDPYYKDDMFPPPIQDFNKTISQDINERLTDLVLNVEFAAPLTEVRMIPKEWTVEYIVDEKNACHLLGQGTFGSAYLGIVKRNETSEPEVVVMKALKKWSKNETSSVLDMDYLAVREMSIMLWMDSVPSTPSLLGLQPVEGGKYWHDFLLIQEYVGDPKTLQTLPLHHFIYMDKEEKGNITDEPLERMWLRIAYEMAVGIKEIHDRGVIDSDIKSNNIALKKTLVKDEVLGRELIILRVNIIDLGKASLGPRHRKPKKDPEGHLKRYRHLAPETAYKGDYLNAADIFGIGYVLRDIIRHDKVGGTTLLDPIRRWCMMDDPELRPNDEQLVNVLKSNLQVWEKKYMLEHPVKRTTTKAPKKTTTEKTAEQSEEEEDLSPDREDIVGAFKHRARLLARHERGSEELVIVPDQEDFGFASFLTYPMFIPLFAIVFFVLCLNRKISLGLRYLMKMFSNRL